MDGQKTSSTREERTMHVVVNTGRASVYHDDAQPRALTHKSKVNEEHGIYGER